VGESHFGCSFPGWRESAKHQVNRRLLEQRLLGQSTIAPTKRLGRARSSGHQIDEKLQQTGKSKHERVGANLRLRVLGPDDGPA
jgi:hypothetical protein